MVYGKNPTCKCLDHIKKNYLYTLYMGELHGSAWIIPSRTVGRHCRYCPFMVSVLPDWLELLSPPGGVYLNHSFSYLRGPPRLHLWPYPLPALHAATRVDLKKNHYISFHCFADDVQIYLPLKYNSKDSIQPLLECLKDVKSWIDTNFFNLKENKTDIIVFGWNPSEYPADGLGPFTPNVRSSVKKILASLLTVLLSSINRLALSYRPAFTN